jgi:16S rRNA processing protein RimM
MSMRRGKPQPGKPEISPGPSTSGGPVFLVVGKLRRPHGVQGEIQMEVVTDKPHHLTPGNTYFYGDEHTPLVLSSRRPHGALILVAFEGIDDRDQAARLTNQLLYITRASLPALPEGEYYHYQLEGLRAVLESGEVLGTLREVLETGSNDVFVVQDPAGREILLPVVEGVILNVDLEKQTITVMPPEWLD